MKNIPIPSPIFNEDVFELFQERMATYFHTTTSVEVDKTKDVVEVKEDVKFKLQTVKDASVILAEILLDDDLWVAPLESTGKVARVRKDGKLSQQMGR